MPQRSPCICRTAACFCSAGGQRDHRAPLPWLQIHTWIRIRGSFHVPDMEPLSCPPCWEAAAPVLPSPPASLIQCFSLMDACAHVPVETLQLLRPISETRVHEHSNADIYIRADACRRAERTADSLVCVNMCAAEAVCHHWNDSSLERKPESSRKMLGHQYSVITARSGGRRLNCWCRPHHQSPDRLRLDTSTADL